MTPTPDLAVQSLARRIGQGLRIGGWRGDDRAPLQRLLPASVPMAPSILSRAHVHPGLRQEAMRRYAQCLNHFRTRVQRGADEDDAALAVAYFLLVNVAALHGLRPRSEALQLVEGQMRRALAGLDAWRDAPLVDRQAAFEQFAVLAVLMADLTHRARDQGEGELAAVKRQAHATLAQWLDVEPSRLVLGEQGLVLELALA